jgi:hypothetical protein
MLRRNFLLCFFIVLLFTAGASAQAFDLEGFYFIKAPVPAAFKNIDHLYLNGTKRTNIGGWIQLKNQTRFKLNTASLSGKNFSFGTRTVGGIRYSFAGKFLRLEKFSDTQPDGVVLSGTLRKYKNGRLVASKFVRYTYFVGD